MEVTKDLTLFKVFFHVDEEYAQEGTKKWKKMGGEGCGPVELLQQQVRFIVLN